MYCYMESGLVWQALHEKKDYYYPMLKFHTLIPARQVNSRQRMRYNIYYSGAIQDYSLRYVNKVEDQCVKLTQEQGLFCSV